MAERARRGAAGAAAAVGKAIAKRAFPTKASPTKATTKQATATKATAKKSTATKATATKATATKATAKRTTATKATAKVSSPKKATAKKATAKKATAKKATAKKATAKKSTLTRTSAADTAGSRSTRQQSPASHGHEAVARARSTRPSSLRVREDESPWTEKELSAVREGLAAEIERLRAEAAHADAEIADLLRDAGDGAGDDQADSGSKAFEREHEMTIANNTRDLVTQNAHALERIADGSYGMCESCGRPIGKRRLQAYPRATLCLECKQRQERH